MAMIEVRARLASKACCGALIGGTVNEESDILSMYGVDTTSGMWMVMYAMGRMYNNIFLQLEKSEG